jgi:MFS family permease
MIAAIVAAWALFVALSMMMLGIGLQGTLLGLRATSEGFATATTGLVMSAYYAGFVGGSWSAPFLVRRVGHIRVFAGLASLASAVVLIHALFVNPPAWFAMRLVSGFAVAGLFVVIESWLNHASSNETRGQILSVYMIVCMGSMGLGQLFLNLADPGEATLFIVVSVLVSLSLVPISLTRHAAPPIDAPRPISLGELYRVSPLGFVGCLASGVAQGAFFSLAAVYAVLVGLDLASTAWFIALPLFGVIVVQYPVGILSDRLDRRIVLTALALMVAALALANVFASFGSAPLQLVAVTAFGGLMIPLYALAIAQMNDHIDSDQMLGASSRMVLIYGVGSMFGPLIVGAVMQSAGALGFFWSLSVVHLVVGVFALYRMSRRGPAASEQQGGFVLVAPRTTPVAAGIAVQILDEGTAGQGPA